MATKKKKSTMREVLNAANTLRDARVPFSPHPAVAVAESDLVKLTREHETLSNEIAVANDRRNALEEELASIGRSQTVRYAKFASVNELINKKINGITSYPR